MKPPTGLDAVLIDATLLIVLQVLPVVGANYYERRHKTDNQEVPMQETESNPFDGANDPDIVDEMDRNASTWPERRQD